MEEKEKTEKKQDLGKISRTKAYAVYAEKTKQDKKPIRAGRFGARER